MSSLVGWVKSKLLNRWSPAREERLEQVAVATVTESGRKRPNPWLGNAVVDATDQASFLCLYDRMVVVCHTYCGVPNVPRAHTASVVVLRSDGPVCQG